MESLETWFEPSLFEPLKYLENDQDQFDLEENIEALSSLSLEPSASDEHEQNDHNDYNDNPLLKCEETFAYISRSKLMVIMKGLPGSGKTTIVKALCKKYPNSVVCSADHYFKTGSKYQFEQEKLPEAHAQCQQTTCDAVLRGASPVIVDNSNVQQWEMKFYVDLADSFNYLVLCLEPDTPWRRDPVMLARRNSHGVEVALLRKKVKIYQSVCPLYFGWFLNESDSCGLMEKAWAWLQVAWQRVGSFRSDVTDRIGVTSVSDLASHFSRGSYALCDARLTHCTARYSARESDEVIERYMASARAAVGRKSALSIWAFVLTPETLGARVALSDEQLALWAVEDDALDPAHVVEKGERKKRYYGPPTKLRRVVIPDYSPKTASLAVGATLREVPLLEDGLVEVAQSRARGRRAHITLGTASDVPPVTTGIQLMNLVRGAPGLDPEGEPHDIPGAVLRNHGKGVWGVYPRVCIRADAVFTYQL